MNRGGLVVLLFLVLTSGLAYYSSRLPPDHLALGFYFTGDLNEGYIFLNTNQDAREKLGVGAFAHEFHHALQSMRWIDFDIPTAAAVGYLEEWTTAGKLYDQSKERYLLSGLGNTPTDKIIRKIFDKYPDQDRELPGSYKDGAVLAGFALRVCGPNKDKAWSYLMGLSIGLSHERSRELCSKPSLSRLLFDLRGGHYTYFDPANAPVDFKDLYNENAMDINEFMVLLKTMYRPTFIRKNLAPDSRSDELLSPSEVILCRRRQRLCLYYKPVTAAVDLLSEVHREGRLSSSALSAAFFHGSRSQDPATEAQELLARYRTTATVSNAAFLRDAAYLAGILNQIFGKDEEALRRYSLGVAAGLDHDVAERISRKPLLFARLDEFRDGRYMSLNLSRFKNDLSAFNAESQRLAFGYLAQLETDYRICFVQYQNVKPQ